MSAFTNQPAARRPQYAVGAPPVVKRKLPRDQQQLNARARDRRYTIAYGILSVLYVALAVAAGILFRKAVWGQPILERFLEPIVGNDVYSARGQSLIGGVKWVFTAMVAAMLIVPMVTVIANFVRRLLRRDRFVYVESDDYLRDVLKGEADEATKQTLDYIRKELLYVDRRCACGQVWLVPADHLVPCPICGQQV